MRARLHQHWRSEVCQRLRWARRSAGLTQVCLAQRMGVGLSTVCAIEQRRQAPDLGTLLLWCVACGVSPYIMVEGLTADSRTPA